tara:strand:- start:28769 stop:29734 length:966 start_codon:yes stop_codon:yes gene_type:complete
MFTISVLYQSYNQAEYIKESLEAILNQKYQALEIIIIDDCSSDNSIDILRNYETKYKNIKLIINQQNKGTASSSNYGIENAKGDLIYFAAADDKIEKNLFEEANKAFLDNANLGLFSARINTIDFKGNLMFDKNQNFKDDNQINVLSNKESLKRLSRNDFWITGQTCVWKRDLLIKNNLKFNEKYKHYMDHFLIINIILRYDSAFLNKKLASWRLLTNSYSSKNFRFFNAVPAFENYSIDLLNSFKDTNIDSNKLKKLLCGYLNNLFLINLKKQIEDLNDILNKAKNNQIKTELYLKIMIIINLTFNYMLYYLIKIKNKVF